MKIKLFFIIGPALLTLLSGAAVAQTSVSSNTFTAVAASTSAGSVALSIQIQNLTGETTSQIWWDNSAITPGSTQWRRADACIVLYSNITSSAGAVQIYTDNTAADANPKFVAAGGNIDPAGIVDTSSASAALPMCWRMTDTSTTTLTIKQTADNQHLYSQELDPGFYCFFFMRDKGSSSITMGDAYLTMKQAFSGMHYSDGNTYNNWSQNMLAPNYIYLGANFSTAKPGKTYRTSTLRIEGFVE